ncbi:MAG: STAS domain-containing protein [Thermoanaerobaculia bacterium]|nr:STAS domain-containing protein [Thermoanaerobaculia bacterium]
MTFEIERVEEDRFELRGRFDASREAHVRRVFEEIEGSCVLDFEELSYISSAGLGLLVALQLRLDEEGEGVTLANVNPHIRELLRLAGLDSIFTLR